jgi:hypothetical protein
LKDGRLTKDKLILYIYNQTLLFQTQWDPEKTSRYPGIQFCIAFFISKLKISELGIFHSVSFTEKKVMQKMTATEDI